MKKKSDIIAMDVDFVLLDWVLGLKPFMEEKGIPTDHLEQFAGSTYYPKLTELFLIDDEELAIKLMKEFNRSNHIENLPIFQKESHNYLKELHNEGYDFRAVTCIGNEPIHKELRAKNLMKVYGDIFNHNKVINIPVRTSKEPYLKELKNEGNVLMFVDDRIPHLNEAIRLDIQPVLYTNDGKLTNNKKIEVIDCLSKLKDVIIKQENKLNNKPKRKVKL
tara:strand:+ start:10867 stop:11526 length:660 start_codon:yes stop_codon:yes gene_type:complete